MSEVTITVNGSQLTVPSDYTILEAAQLANIRIPTLCHLDLHDINLKAVNQSASCRVCLVEVKGRRNLSPSCATTVADGMVIETASKRAIKGRRTMVELLLSDHPTDCLICAKNQNCDLQKLAADLGIRGELKYNGAQSTYPKDHSSQAIYRDPDKCIMCRRCETMCNKVQTCGILTAKDRGFEAIVSPAFNLSLDDTMCTFCGQCVSVCPTAALVETNHIGKVWKSLHNKDKVVIVQTAPAVRVALGEDFGYAPGTVVTGQMVSALRALGFDRVFDTDFAADVTILEEAHEMIERMTKGGRLPILTSCCPAWVKFIEHQFPDLLDVPSTCKSPHEMFGAIAKTYYAEKMGLDPKNMVVVSIMPCLAKKHEANRSELRRDGMKDVDYVLSTRELSMMIREVGIDFKQLPEAEFDHPLGESTGAAVMFGTTGGVIEAALRTAYEWLTGTALENVAFQALRGLEGIRVATVDVSGKPLSIGVAHGLGNARKLLDGIRSGELKLDAIEIMACPGGCVGGGGQPLHHGDESIIQERQKAIYAIDKDMPRRKSHENAAVNRLYKDFLGEIGGQKAHELLHTSYTERELI